MDNSLRGGKLHDGRSDPRDHVLATNAARSLLNREGRFYRATQTTDATAATIWTMAIQADTALTLEARILGKCVATDEVGGYHKAITIDRQGAGVPRIVGAQQTIGTDVEDDASWDAGFALDLVGGNVTVFVLGAAGKTIGWNVGIHALEAPWPLSQ